MMDDSSLHTNSADELQPDIDAMYQSFMEANELLNASQQILDLATHLTGAENCSLMLLNGHGELYVLNAIGLNGANWRTSQIKVGEGVAGQVAKEGSPLLIEDISLDARFSFYKRERYRTGSFIAYPITTREKVIGVLNLADKKSGEPFNPEDFEQVMHISMVAAAALSSFQRASHLTFHKGVIDAIYHRLVEAECNNREFVARLSHGMRTPLNNIKGAVYSLRISKDSGKTKGLEFYDIIEKEVDYLITFLDEGVRSYEHTLTQLANIEERERYRKLLE
jgi:transcriptional regulator with GAF, ATPase, and Fis domain